MQDETNSMSSETTNDLDGTHWLTSILHQTSKAGLDVSPAGSWSSAGDHGHCLMNRFSRVLSSHEDSPPAVLCWLASFDDASVKSRIAEHPNTPVAVLHKLGRHHDPEVRCAVADNPVAPFEILMELAKDDNPDVRYRIAENANIHHDILAHLCDDENPFVAQRAKQSISQRWQSKPPVGSDKPGAQGQAS